MSEVIDKKQKMLLELAFSNKDIFIKVSKILRCEYFEAPLDIVLKFVIEYFNEYNSLPSMDIIDAETDIKLKNREIDEKDKVDVQYAVDEIEKHCQHVAMSQAILAGVEKDLPIGDFISITNRVKEALMVSIDNSLGINLFDDPASRLLDMQKNIETRSIGWPTMDQMIEYIRRGEFFLIAGGTAAGKSIVLANIGNNLASQGLNTLYITLELKDNMVAKRLDSIITGIPSTEIFENIEDVADELKKHEKNYGTFYVKKMSRGTRCAEIRAYLSEYHLQFGFYPDCLCVDYLDLLSPNGRTDPGRFEIDKAISEELAEIFMDFNLYGFTASQLNRDGSDTTVKIQAHIAGGISKLNTADVALAINRDEVLKDRGEIEFQVLKLRSAEGKTHSLTLHMNPKTIRITEKPELNTYMSVKNSKSGAALARAKANKNKPKGKNK